MAMSNSDKLHVEPTPMGWTAYYDPEGLHGDGPTKADALEDLLEQTDEAWRKALDEREAARKPTPRVDTIATGRNLDPATDFVKLAATYSDLLQLARELERALSEAVTFDREAMARALYESWYAPLKWDTNCPEAGRASCYRAVGAILEAMGAK